MCRSRLAYDEIADRQLACIDTNDGDRCLIAEGEYGVAVHIVAEVGGDVAPVRKQATEAAFERDDILTFGEVRNHIVTEIELRQRAAASNRVGEYEVVVAFVARQGVVALATTDGVAA